MRLNLGQSLEDRQKIANSRLELISLFKIAPLNADLNCMRTAASILQTKPTLRSFLLCLATFLFGFGYSLRTYALNDSPQTFTLDGTFFQVGGSAPLIDSAAKVTVQILNPTGTCLLYEEQQTVNTVDSAGRFHLNVGSNTGSAKRTVNDPGRSMNQIFQNFGGIAANNVPGQTCAGGVYTPSAGAIRYFRLTVTPSTTNIADVLSPDIVIDSVPQAMIAQSVQGLERANILQTSTAASAALTQSNLEAAFTGTAYTNLQSILAGNFMKTDSSGATLPAYAATPAGVSNGDIWFDTTTNQIKYQTSGGVQTVGAAGGGTISSLTVGSSMSLNGSVAGTISTGSGTIDLTNTGISAGTYAKLTVDAKGRATAGTVSLVEADIPNLTVAGKVSGNTITSGTISGSTAINTSGNLITTGTISGLTVQSTNLRVYNGANYIQFVAPTLAGIVNFTLPDNDGNPGDVLTSNGSGVLSWATGTTTLAGDVSGSSGATSVDKIKGKAITAGSVSGQMMIYDGTAWNNAVMSGDATLSYTGILSLNKVPVAKGGTNSSAFGNNRMIASNGTGSALVDFTCGLNQVISFDASGNSTCANVSSLFAGILNGGNTTGADISIGTNDAKSLFIKTNDVNRFSLNSTDGLVRFAFNGSSISPVSVNSASMLLHDASGAIPRLVVRDGYFSGPVEVEVAAIHSNTGLIGTATNHPLAFQTNNSEGMRLTTSGRLGIGTQSPSSALDVSGAITAEGMSSAPSVSASNTGRIYFDYSANKFKVSQNGGGYVDLISPAATAGFLNGGNAFGSAATLGTTDSNSLSLITNNSPRLTILSGGNIGIGISTPAAGLEVSSQANFGSVNLSGTSVFPVLAGHSSNSPSYTGAVNAFVSAGQTVGAVHAGMWNVKSTNPDSFGFVGIGRAETSWSTNTTFSAVATGAWLPGLAFAGATSSATWDAEIGAAINGVVDGTVSAGNIPTAIVMRTSTTNNTGLTERLRITSAGTIGVGISTPRGSLDVAGTILPNAAVSNATATIDASTGNTQYTSSSCGAFQFNNMKDGGNYMFVVKGTTSATCSFTAFTGAGSGALTVHMPPDHTATTAAKHTIYNFTVVGSDVYVAWTPGY